MRVFFRFRNAKLRLSQRGQVSAKRIGQALRPESDLHPIAKRFIILRHADVIQREEAVSPRKAIELRQDECARDLPRAVRPEVEEDNAVVLPDRSHRRAVFRNDNGHHKLIRHARIIRSLHRRLRVFRQNAFSIDQRRICLFHALKPVVPVHGIIAPHHGRNLTAAERFKLVLQRMDVAFAAFRRHIASIHKAVDEHILQAVVPRQLHECIQVRQVTMYAAVAAKAVKVQRGTVLFAVFDRAEESGIFEEVPVLNGFRDARQLLIHHAPGADVQVADLGIAHLSCREAHRVAGGLDLRMWICVPKFGDVLRTIGADGISFRAFPAAETV